MTPSPDTPAATTGAVSAVGGAFASLREQLTGAAEAFAGSRGGLDGILTGLVDDVDRALREPLEVFPVCHHSPASALAMVQRLRAKQPSVIYLELCEDLEPLLIELRNCKLPVALQAFASELDGHPEGWAPLSVVAPITAASAEYQAIAYALETPGVELVLVDRSTDHVFQWLPKKPGKPENDEEAELHGDAVGLEIGDLRPGFAELEEHLLHHGKVRHWSEWWDQYVEQPLVGADYDTYRQVMVLIGSLFRRLRPSDAAKHDRDEDRERYMWTRMREHLARTGTDRSRALYVCGAFHAASHVAEFGADAAPTDFTISERTGTKWLYGMIPSSHSAIEAQFGLTPGSVSIAAATWQKAVSKTGAKPFALGGKGARSERALADKKLAASPPTPAQTEIALRKAALPKPVDKLSGFLSRPPRLDDRDEAELLGWCVDIVRLARRNGYLSSTADAIAIFETSILLAGMRGRARPTPYDFQDAAITCIEKDSVPGRRDVRRLCEILLGGDRIGSVGYYSLPPLARDVYDRLEPLGLNLEARTVQRALLDLAGRPDLVPASRLLWRLRYLLPSEAVRPIMGERRLGEKASIQESWDLAIGKYQRSLIELGYEGVAVEQVLEQRLRQGVRAPEATAATALAAVEDAILYLDSPTFVNELGARAVELLGAERTVDDAPAVLRRIRRLLAHYRATEPELPEWCEQFVVAGYAHYCTLLPTAFVDEQTGVRQVAAMLGFLFSLESLALTLGCDRAQLELAVAQSHPETPAKLALVWAANVQLGTLSRAELRERCDELLDNPLVLPAFPQYLSGFVQALEPVPNLAPFVVEVLSKAFGRLPDPVLLPWLPSLITTLRDQAGELVPALVREAGRTFPGTLPALDAFVPPWEAPPPAASSRPVANGPVTDLLLAHPAGTDALVGVLGLDPSWPRPHTSAGGPSPAVAALLAGYPESAAALAALLPV
ncbi:DUF5682 family protein [Cryptosporangium japonicum]|uniref:Uncharacterized protein n=1 Tax=Cryptosporangium japonicum TaxID=80872 RepID=A0ABN0V091_9ACTN